MVHEPAARAGLFDALSTAVLVFDGNFVLREVNAAAQNLLGLSDRRIVGSAMSALFHPAEALTDALRHAELNACACYQQNVHLRIVPEPRERVVDYFVTPLEDSGAARFLVEMIDAERRDRLLREESLLAQYQVNHTLIRGFAHEVKNPLGGIRGAAQLLERELDGRESLIEYTRVIIEETDRLDQLITRMSNPDQGFQPEPISIHEILEHVRQLISADASGRFSIERDYDPSLPDLNGDRAQLIQAFINLVKNAAAAVSDGGTITLRTRADFKSIGTVWHRLVIRVDVIDDGHGISDTLRDAIFYPLVTGSSSGTGLGLPIAQALVRRHGGLIEFESAPGRTVFTTWLPLHEQA
jgi:two-component system nitrogen regulation sensor histidine kinase GlnL